MSALQLAPLLPDQAEAAADALVPAFEHDPTLAWCFLAEAAGYAERLRGYFLAGHRWHIGIGQPAQGAFLDGRLVGACYTGVPGAEPPADATRRLFGELRASCGAEATRRFAHYNERVDEELPEGAHHSLAIVGVHPDLQRSGAGSALVGWTCALCDADSGSEGVVLDTGNEANLAFYARFGFAEVARVDFDGFSERVLLRPRAAA